MTGTTESITNASRVADQATWVPAPDLQLRVRPAELARIIGVSRQGVQKAIASGRIRVDADGRVDPRRAVSDWIRNTHPGSMRARSLRDAAAEQRTASEQARYWRDQADDARRALADREATERERARATRTAIQNAATDALARALPPIADDVAQHAVALAEQHAPERLHRALERGTLAGLIYRAAWRALAPAIAASIAEDTQAAAAPADPDPAADAPLFADLEENPDV